MRMQHAEAMTVRIAAASEARSEDMAIELPGDMLSQRTRAAPAVREDLPPVPLMLRGWSLAHLAVFGALVFLCLGACAIVYHELVQDESAPVEPDGGGVAKLSDPAVKQTDAPFALPPIENYAEVTMRPLFSATRRPAPPQAVPRGSLEPASLVLTGVILTSDGRMALVQEAKSPKPTRLKEGQEIQGWTVQSILPDRVVIHRGTVEQAVKLHDDSKRVRFTAPATAARTQ